MFNPERVPYEARVLECKSLLRSLNEPGQLVLSDATVDALVEAGFITFGFEAARCHPEEGKSGIVFEFRFPQLPVITLEGRTIPEKPSTLSFVFEQSEHRALLAHWIFGSAQPERRALPEGGEYRITPVTDKLLSSINGYANRTLQQLIQYVRQQSIT